jgi:Uma2 family endonuclease
MTSSVRQPRLTFAEYLVLERGSETKHEFLDGRTWAMAGGTIEHAQLAANVIGELHAQLRGRGCRVFTSDLRVRVAATGLATYPDVTVVCGAIEPDADDEHTVRNPVVLVEVLSDSTEAYDRSEKFAHYRRIPSLRAYVLVSQTEARIEVYGRNDDGSWTLHEARPPGAAVIAAVDCRLDVATVYEEVSLAASG